MTQGDVSFSFLHRVEEVEQNIEDGRWQSALALALTLPDICGGIAFPDVVKRYRDGRIILDRQKNPTRDVGGQYIRWFDEYAADHFKLSVNDSKPYICGNRCWQLRCEYLHQNKGFLNEEGETAVRFHLGVNCGTSVCQLDQNTVSSGGFDIRIDIRQFCLRMCRAARDYYNRVHMEKDFSLYNTPVLDFVQAQKLPSKSGVIALICGNESYTKELLQVLMAVSEHVQWYKDPGMARKKLAKDRPDMWIVTNDMMKQPDQPWRADKTTPVIILARSVEKAKEIVKLPDRLIFLSMPIRPEDLRSAVKRYLMKE